MLFVYMLKTHGNTHLHTHVSAHVTSPTSRYYGGRDVRININDISIINIYDFSLISMIRTFIAGSH